MPIEVNVNGFRKKAHYPNRRFIEIGVENRNDFIIGVDAHKPEELLDFENFDGCVKLVTNLGGKVINLLIAIVLFTFMTAAFIAGWFNMIKIAVLQPDREDPNSLIKEFVGGVGEYFLSSLGMIFVMYVYLSVSSFIHLFTSTLSQRD